MFVQDRRDAHIERINNNRNIVHLSKDAIVIAHAVVQISTGDEEVAKLLYQVRGPY